MEYKFDHRDKLPELLNMLGLTGKGAEVGTFKGAYSKTIVSKWPGKLYMIDVWRALPEEEYDDYTNNRGHIDAYSESMSAVEGYEDRAFMLRMKGDDAAELFPDGSLDFVYIDANHNYASVKSDIECWYPKVKRGGLLLGHDYLPNDMYSDDRKDLPIYGNLGNFLGMFGVNTAVNEFSEKTGYKISKTDEWFGTWWIKKN